MDINQDISIILQKLNRHWQQVAVDNHGVSRIDKDVLLNEVRHLYERLLELDIDQPRTAITVETIKPPARESSQNIEKSREIELREVEEKPVAKEKPVENEKPIEKVMSVHIIKPEEDKKLSEKKEVAVETPAEKPGIAESKAEARVIEPGVAESKPKPQRRNPISNADKFAAHKTLADRFARDDDRSYAAKLKNHKPGDIKSAIGINDRFLFINEIFKGNHQQYQEAMTKFNTCDNYHQALEYLERIKTKNQIENNEALTALLDIVKRKYQ